MEISIRRESDGAVLVQRQCAVLDRTQIRDRQRIAIRVLIVVQQVQDNRSVLIRLGLIVRCNRSRIAAVDHDRHGRRVGSAIAVRNRVGEGIFAHEPRLGRIGDHPAIRGRDDPHRLARLDLAQRDIVDHRADRVLLAQRVNLDGRCAWIQIHIQRQGLKALLLRLDDLVNRLAIDPHADAVGPAVTPAHRVVHVELIRAGLGDLDFLQQGRIRVLAVAVQLDHRIAARVAGIVVAGLNLDTTNRAVPALDAVIVTPADAAVQRVVLEIAVDDQVLAQRHFSAGHLLDIRRSERNRAVRAIGRIHDEHRVAIRVGVIAQRINRDRLVFQTLRRIVGGIGTLVVRLDLVTQTILVQHLARATINRMLDAQLRMAHPFEVVDIDAVPAILGNLDDALGCLCRAKPLEFGNLLSINRQPEPVIGAVEKLVRARFQIDLARKLDHRVVEVLLAGAFRMDLDALGIMFQHHVQRRVEPARVIAIVDLGRNKGRIRGVVGMLQRLVQLLQHFVREVNFAKQTGFVMSCRCFFGALCRVFNHRLGRVDRLGILGQFTDFTQCNLVQQATDGVLLTRTFEGQLDWPLRQIDVESVRLPANLVRRNLGHDLIAHHHLDRRG